MPAVNPRPPTLVVPPRPKPERKLRREHLDVKAAPGEHIFDAAPFAEELKELLAGDWPHPFEQTVEFVERCEQVYLEFPTQLRRVVDRFSRNGNDFGILLIQNLPQDPALPNTPSNSRRALGKATFLSEALLGCIGGGLGSVYSYRQQNNGDMFHNICPVKKNSTAMTGQNSLIDLSFHTDGASHPMPPDFVLFDCLRGDPCAQTRFSTTPDIMRMLDPADLEALRRREFVIRPDFEFGEVEASKLKIKVFEQTAGPTTLRFDNDLMEADDPEAERLIGAFLRVLRKTWVYLTFEAGDFAVLDNRRTVHSRSVYSPRYDGHDRWLQVAYAKRDITGTCESVTMRDRIVDVDGWCD